MKNHVSRRSFLQGALAVSAGALAACVAPAAPDSDTGADEGAAMEPVHLRWDTFRGIGSGWNEERIETFQEMHSDVTIELRPLAGSGQQDNYAKMYAAQAAGDLGEVIAFDPSHYHFWRAINKDIIMPIDELVAADGTDLDEWFEHFLGLQYYKGQLYGFPSWGWAGFDTLVTNAVHLEEAGIDLPDPAGRDVSIDTINEWAHSFYVEGERFGLNFSHGEAAVVVLCRLFGSSLINEEGTKSMLLDDPNATEAMQWVYKLGVEDKILPAPGDIDNAGGALVAGLLTMNWCGSLCVRNFNNQIEDESVAKAWQILFPAREDGRYPSQLRGGTWNLRTDQDHADVAFQFLRHIAGHDGSLSFNLVAGNFAMVRPDVVQSLIDEDPIHEWFISSLENGIPAHAPANSRGREYTSAVQQWTDLLLDPNQPVEFEKGLQDLHDNIQSILDQDPA